jgi:hypothetical protein
MCTSGCLHSTQSQIFCCTQHTIPKIILGEIIAFLTFISNGLHRNLLCGAKKVAQSQPCPRIKSNVGFGGQK